jgi:DNA-directed RNA polymerase specialized sigma24 family protein
MSDETNDNQQIDDRLISELSKTTSGMDVENRIYWQKLAQLLPWKTIFIELSERETRVFLLHAIECLSNEEIALELNDNVVFIEYELTKIKARIRARLKKICGKNRVS